MKLPDFLKFESFNRLRAHMNAPLVDFELERPTTLTTDDLQTMVTIGKDIDKDELRILPDGTLAYKNSRVLLHIRDISMFYRDSEDVNLPKFHLAHCKTLEKMRNDNRFNRYVVSIRTDGWFNLNFIYDDDHTSKLEELNVCMNCLDALNYKEYRRYELNKRRAMRDNFSIDEFFNLYPQSLLVNRKPRYTSIDAPINKYPENWEQISLGYREQKKFKCEECAIDLSDSQYKRYLHVHHRNGLKNDCTEENLSALCVYCHAQEPMHAHVKSGPDYVLFLSVRQKLLKKNNHNSSTKQEEFNLNIESNSNDEITDPYGTAQILAEKKDIETEDNRYKEGAFWVYHDKSNDDLAYELERLNFRYRPGRGWWKK